MACFPISNSNSDIWNLYKKAQSSFWIAEEINLYEDLNDWQKLNENEKHFISMVLAFFAEADAIVNENISSNLIEYVSNIYKHAGYFYAFQIAMENIHNETYSLLIETYIKCEEEKTKLLSATKNYPCVAAKNEWARKWIKDNDHVKNLLAFVIVEGLFFSGSFCSLFWLKDRGLMKGLTFSNELISRDEGLHVEFGIHIYNKLIHDKLIQRLEQEIVHEIFKEAIEIEKEFICQSITCSLIGMNKNLMCEYIQFVADRLLKMLGYEPLSQGGAKNPFPFMENISMMGKTNFFEKKNSEYMISMDTSKISFQEEQVDF